VSAAKAPAGGPSITGYLPALLPLACVAGFALLLPGVMADGGYRVAWDWVPGLDVALSFRIDGLALLFALMISGIGVFIFLYAGAYMAGHPQFWRFFLYLGGFMLAMLGLVTADNLIALFVFWELTSVTSYLLIGFNHEDAESRRKALQALIVTGAGGLAMLAGFLVLGLVGGSFEISELDRIAVQQSELYVPILVLVLLGAFTKSAQFPFHFWLPNAMAAPTPVSAYLHSATMVKAGVYLMARVNPALGETDLWFWTLVIAGGFTTVFASILAVRQTDIKQVLAYTTLMALGALTLFIGAGTGAAIKAMMTFLVVHSLYKAALFLMIGIVDHETGSREVSVLRGLGRKMPITFLGGALAAISMAGIPPFVGFIGKEFLYKAGLELEMASLWVTGTIFAASALMFVAAGIAVLRPFTGPLGETPQTPHEGPWAMWIGPLILGAFSLGFGLFPDTIEAWLVAPGTWAVYGDYDYPVDLYLFREVNAAFLLSLATFATGAVLYAVHRPMRDWLGRVFEANPIKFDPGWDRVLDGLKALAAWQTGILQSGVLQRYIFTVFATFAIGIGATMYFKDALDFRIDWAASLDGLLFMHWAVLVFITAGSLFAAMTSSRMTAIAALGVVGVGIALVFIMFSAPDVAITQLLVETLVVVLVAVAMLKLPHLALPQNRQRRPTHVALAGVVGVLVTLVLLGVLQGEIDMTIPEYFAVTSWPEAYGRNIVNVILVDFRALDTFGEIAVVVIAALSAYALLRGTRYDRTDAEKEDRS